MRADTPAQEPNPPNLFANTPAAVEVLHRLGQGLGVRKPLLLVTGESGMGKTPLVREAVGKFGERASIAWMVEPHLDAKELLPKLLELFGGTARPGTSPLAHAERLMMTLANVTAGGRIAVLVVDDAHALPDDALLELARVAERAGQRQCPLEILLVGRPSLAVRLAEQSLGPVNEQISLRFELPALNAHHTRRYLLLLPAPAGAEHPPQYSRKACRDIHNASRGVPRDVEALAAESARLATLANATTVSPEHVRAAVQAIGARPAPRPKHEAKPEHRKNAATKPAAHAKAAAPAKTDVHAKAAAPAKPDPPVARVLEAAAVKPLVSPSANSSAESSPSGEFVPSDDPRVKNWVARFGGSGVRLGGYHTGPVPDEPVEASDASPGSSRTVAEGGADEPVNWPPVSPSRASHRRKGPVLGKRSSSSYGWPVVALVLAIALGAVLWAQRQPVEGAKHPVADSAHATPTKPRENSPVPDAKPQTAKPELAKSQVAKSQTAKPQPAKPELAKSQTKSAEAKAAPSQKKRDEKPLIATTAQSIERSVPVPPKPKKPATQPATPAAKPGPHYTMMVASFLKKDMAFAEREHLSRLTNHPVWVSQRKINGVRTYRIILGAFESSDLAEDAAQKLLQRGLIRDARILALPLDP